MEAVVPIPCAGPLGKAWKDLLASPFLLGFVATFAGILSACSS